MGLNMCRNTIPNLSVVKRGMEQTIFNVDCSENRKTMRHILGICEGLKGIRMKNHDKNMKTTDRQYRVKI